MNELITIAVFSEDKAGLLQRVTAPFTRRKINIESLTVSESEVKGIHRYTIIVLVTEELAAKVTAALEKKSKSMCKRRFGTKTTKLSTAKSLCTKCLPVRLTQAVRHSP